MLGVSLQLVQAGDVVVNFVQQVSQRCPADAVGGGEGNAGQAELFLNDRLGPVGQLEGNDSADSTADQADDGAAGSIIADSSAEDEVVVAPEVDHDAVGSLQNQHQDVDAQDDEDDHSGQGVSPGSGGTGRPTHIHDVGMQAKAGDHVLHAGANLCNKGVDDQVDTTEANTGGDTALQQGADLNTQTNTTRLPLLCSALPPKRHIYNIIFRHAAQVLRRVFLSIGTFAGLIVCFLPDKNAQSPSILPGGQGGILRRPQ